MTEMLAREEAALNTRARIQTPPMDMFSASGMLGSQQSVSPSLHVPTNGSSESQELFNINSILRTIDEIINRAWFEQRALSQLSTRTVDVISEGEVVDEEARRRTL